MKILICDDEKMFLDILGREIERILHDLGLDYSIGMYQTGSEFLEAYSKNPEVDIVFMDILLEDENGYKIASEIRTGDPMVKIIFLTSVTKYVLKGYEIGASRYLLKPVTTSKLKEVLLKTIDEVRKSADEYIIEKNDNGIYKIFMRDIVYIETSGRNTIIHTNSQDIISYQTMKKHLSRLNAMFIRCHSGIIINLEYVVEMKKDSIKMLSNNIVPLSKNRKYEVKEALTKYLNP